MKSVYLKLGVSLSSLLGGFLFLPSGQGSAEVFDVTEASEGPALTIEANIEGQVTTVASGPGAATLDADIPAALSYTVSNTGDTYLFDLSVEDDTGNSVNCPVDELAVGMSTVCTSSVVPAEGLNQTVVSAQAQAASSPGALITEITVATGQNWELQGHSSPDNVPGDQQYDSKALRYQGLAGESLSALTFTVEVGGSFDDSLAIDLDCRHHRGHLLDATGQMLGHEPLRFVERRRFHFVGHSDGTIGVKRVGLDAKRDFAEVTLRRLLNEAQQLCRLTDCDHWHTGRGWIESAAVANLTLIEPLTQHGDDVVTRDA